jgi:hypothetical protein
VNKYHNQPVIFRGYRFDSKAEARRYEELFLLQQAGQIDGLQVHPRYLLIEAQVIGGKRERPVWYVGDFQYWQDGRQVVEDTKGGKATQTPLWKLKWRLVRSRYPDIEFRIVEGI